MMSSGRSRREFLGTGLAAGAAFVLAGCATSGGSGMGGSGKKLRVLVLGGTGQTGPHLVEDLLERGHEVTLLNRGNRSEDLFPDVECIIADRDPEKPDGLDALRAEVERGRRWDIAMDIWPSIPKIVENTAELLKGSVGSYMYVSSMSVYVDHSQPNQDETAAVGKAPDADNMEFTMELYGAFKAECENRVRRTFPVNHAIFRPGLIVGPRDFSFRGVYWPVRVRRGGEVLAPGSGDDVIQIIDARDLTAFEVRCMERGTRGTFNVVGPSPRDPLTMGRLLRTCREVSGSDATFTWVSAAFLAEHNVGPWMNMPCWLPTDGEYAGFGSRNVRKAIDAGLGFTPLDETVRDTLEWYDTLPAQAQDFERRGVGVTPAREEAVLVAWHARERVEG